jgi:glycerol-3-phosphate dehydrogenase
VAALIDEVARRYQLPDPVAARLVRLYGSEAFLVLGTRPTPLSPSMFVEEVAWAVDVEGARSIEDVVYRRLRAAWFLPDEVEALVQRAADLMALRLGWSSGEIERQTAAVRGRLADELGFRHSAVSGASR